MEMGHPGIWDYWPVMWEHVQPRLQVALRLALWVYRPQISPHHSKKPSHLTSYLRSQIWCNEFGNCLPRHALKTFL